jgi:acyl-coenzyme A synthetase/AMP-(fatty) acid ligase
VQLKPGASIDETGLLAFALTRLNGLRVPAAIRCLESLPRTATGKVQKYRLRGRA